MYQEHFKSCGYCQNVYRTTKLAELGHMIKGTSYPNTNTNDQLKKAKLRELGRMIKG